MELRHLRHFVALAEERSFTRAAARELIVQSGLSSSVRALEKDVGALLFVRGTRPVRLTSEGEALVSAARRALDAVDASYQAVRDVRGLLTGHLRIGGLQTSGHSLPFASWIAGFSRAHPGVNMTVRQLPALRMLAMVGEGELDCALVSAECGRVPGLDVVPLLSEPIALACAQGQPLATAESVTLQQLAGERFVETHPEWAIRSLVDAAFHEAGLTRHIVCEVDEWTTVLGLVAEGVGVTFVSQPLNFALLPGNVASLRLIPLRGVRLERRIDLVLPKGHAASPAARRFVEYVRQALPAVRDSS
ncbi:LysR substrate-binding domain-containing protein [Streptomyces sp. NPDC058246]|uniref:LysR substrate-binding domain-containing protein n=1 Tax=Streptomyces sp. NPDC058246 TaxID=3346400 RepID=UPI0036E81388